MTHLLVPGPNTPHSSYPRISTFLTLIQKQYHGHRTTSDCPRKSAANADTYIQSYTSSAFPARSFTLNRYIIYHDSAPLEALITSLVGSTSYWGWLKVTFPVTHSRVAVYSPCWQNDYREKL